MGCNTLAYLILYSRYNSRTGYTTACASVCESPKALTNGSWLGVGCCQNAITDGLTRYDVYFKSVHKDSNSYQFNQCCYAALVATETFNFSSEFITTMRFNETYKGQQPLVLDWAIGNVTCNVAKNMPSYACRDRNSACVDSTNGPGYLCKCSDGYEGNPYLSDGCTDVDECKQNSSSCPRGTCIGSSVLVIIIFCTRTIFERQKLTNVKKQYFQQHGGFLLLEKTKSDQGLAFTS
ncbi:hypothetical protein EJB05_30520, partial [Eragrostis curvula]